MLEKIKKVKISVHCPKNDVEKVRQAICDAGAGIIGNYSHCSFVTDGVGYSLPMNGANPTIGSIGQIEKIKESKIEFICN